MIELITSYAPQLLQVLYVLLWLALLAAAWVRLRHLLLYFQQEEYAGVRYARWWLGNAAFDKKFSLAFLILLFWALAVPSYHGAALVEYALAVVLISALAVTELNPTSGRKKNLVFTARAKRIFGVALALAVLKITVLMALALYWHISPAKTPMGWLWGALIIFVQALPLYLIVANLILIPVEQRERAKFYNAARQKLAALRPTIIGITGSFGKTSTKNFLAHLLGFAAPTLATPGSVNTVMGITRVVREQLKPEHQFFVVEMGDYEIGAVAEKCQLAPPAIAAITAVGVEHFERFKSLDAIAQTKFEIAEAVWANGGVCVINATQVAPEFLTKYNRQPQQAVLITATPQAGAFVLADIQQTAAGLGFTLTTPAGEKLTIQTPLYGTQHASNVAVALVLALHLGVPASTLVAAAASLPQVKHRLEVKRSAGQPTYIDDAYNGNPEGFAAALDILDLLGTAQGGQRILVTPGLVELGTLHDVEHARLGALAVQKADWVIVVVPERVPSFVAAFKGNNKVRVDCVPSFAAARALLASAGAQDVILLANDLPDLYEGKIDL